MGEVWVEVAMNRAEESESKNPELSPSPSSVPNFHLAATWLNLTD
jgi:hypothetical protein